MAHHGLHAVALLVLATAEPPARPIDTAPAELRAGPIDVARHDGVRVAICVAGEARTFNDSRVHDNVFESFVRPLRDSPLTTADAFFAFDSFTSLKSKRPHRVYDEDHPLDERVARLFLPVATLRPRGETGRGGAEIAPRRVAAADAASRTGRGIATAPRRSWFHTDERACKRPQACASEPRGRKVGPPGGFACGGYGQAESRRRCLRLVEDRERTTGAAYDWVVSVRPDLLVDRKLRADAFAKTNASVVFTRAAKTGRGRSADDASRRRRGDGSVRYRQYRGDAAATNMSGTASIAATPRRRTCPVPLASRRGRGDESVRHR